MMKIKDSFSLFGKGVFWGLVIVAMTALKPEAVFANESVENFFRTVTLADMRQVWKKTKGLTINPYLKAGYDWSSNVFKASDQSVRVNPNSTDAVTTKHSDSTWTIRPGISADYQGSNFRVGGSYEAAFKYFNRFSEQNTQDQQFMTYAQWRPTKSTYLQIREDFKQVGETAGSPVFEPTNVRDNFIDVTAGIKLDSGQTIETLYQNYAHDFQETLAKRYSYTENRYGIRGYQPLTQSIELFSGVDVGTVGFEDFTARDTVYWEIPGGLRGKFFWGWEGIAQVAIHHRNLEASNENDLTQLNSKIALQRKFDLLGNRDRLHNPTSVEFGFVRRAVEGTFSTATTYDEKMFYSSLKHLFTEKIRGRISVYAGNHDYEDRVFTGSRVVVGGAVFSTTPNQIRRSDDLFGTTVGMDYSLCDHLKLHLDYSYSRRESNMSGIDFADNTISLRTTIPL